MYEHELYMNCITYSIWINNTLDKNAKAFKMA